MNVDDGTGDCFPVAFGQLLEHPGQAVTLVHGMVHVEGVEPHWHAWVEVETSVEVPSMVFDVPHFVTVKQRWAIDKSNGHNATLPATLYRKLGNATEAREYTRAEAFEQALTNEHYGPWPT